ncbi:DNA-binding IclR family transcriptional regulator [Achromobacter deleyi]|uniref:IclR family transcriptional regulator n=1 Tax=Achromobacter TaxID=222 RepID=UPI000CFB6848|nr:MULTISPECIES: IclR family transcriptional regulator C-terminal domain-containing protein [Achromobacter]MDR6602422.1 DNA-binding IclR family transcriptional regulator [Achromobacter deleyi]PQZ71484.1 IclR family transcriptional regulator [Achromobacter sp. MYb9]
MSTPDRMLSILDLFRDGTTAAFQEDVMAHLECSRATAYRYLKSLTESGLLAPTAGGAYVLGSRIIELDRHLRQHDPLMRAARDVMRATGDELHANLMLCSYYGDKVLCVDRYWTDNSIESSYARGRPFPMFRGATAKPILANLPPYQLRNLMLWHAAEIREAGLGDDWDAFRANLKRLRTAGVCVSHGEVDRGLMGIGAAIFSAEQKVVGSLVFIASQAHTPPERLDLLQARIQVAAAEVSRNLQAPQSNGAAAIGIMPSRPRRIRAPAGSAPARPKA